jgi:hypothetical protein
VPDDAVTLAYLHSNQVTYSWHQSLMDLIGWDLTHQQRVIRGGWLSMKAATGGVVEGRNDAVRGFLEQRDAAWLWWVDTDMGFAPDTVDRLLEAADPETRPVVGALCFAYKELGPDGMGGARCAPLPTIFDWRSDGQTSGFQGWSAYPVAQLVRCDGTGAACILVHRGVLERMAAKFGPTWYDRAPNPSGDGWISEDLSFCMRLGALGVPLHVHTGVRATHAKQTWVAEEDYWQWAVAPPAAQETAVLVPVLGRPQHAEPFMRSLRASTGLARAYAVCQSGDEATGAAWLDAGADVLESGEQTSFAAKANLAYTKTSEPWLFLVGSDVQFHPGWLDHAQAIAADRYHVVGTNDLGNPQVTSGEHATHLLVRRAYVDETGASWDGPGVVCHEGYRHWFTDNEIVTAAKQRGVWAMALGSKVEHLHPLWGKGEPDAVYELGQSFVDADRALFRERLAKFGRVPEATR